MIPASALFQDREYLPTNESGFGRDKGTLKIGMIS